MLIIEDKRVEEITLRQSDFLEKIIKYKEQKGYSPTLRELGDLMGVTHNAALANVQALAKKGYLHYSSNVARSIVIIKMPDGGLK